MLRPDIRVLTLRNPHPDGTDVADRVTVVSGDFSAALSQLVLFVHGYNNTAEDATDSYVKFLGLSGLASAGEFGPVCLLHWPGNHRWSIFSFASYPFEYGKAEQSGRKLYDFLKNLPHFQDALEVRLVCHSLGNRLAMQLLAEADQDDDPQKPRFMICLMAPAVSVKAVNDRGRYAAAARIFQKTLVLYSGSDPVLGYAFPIGDMAAGGGWFPTAVGKRGEPTGGLWTERADMGAYGYGHSSYWSGSESADAVVRFYDPTAARQTPERATLSAPPIASATIASRELGSRQVGMLSGVAFA